MASAGTPCRMKLYWSLRTKTFLQRLGIGLDGNTIRLRYLAGHVSQIRFRQSQNGENFRGTSGRNMSTLMSATIDFGSTVGCAAKYFEPSSPFSSPVTNTKQQRALQVFGMPF
jgi:hypothetical protein